jgi:hypothetical protein
VTNKAVINVAASVRARLLNQARAQDRPYNELLHYFAMERLLYRFAQLPQARDFVRKGALMMRCWGGSSGRATKDIDPMRLLRSLSEG